MLVPMFALASTLALVGCQRTDRTESKSAPSIAVASAFTPARGEPIDLHGITVTFRDDGMVAIQGRDRFGNALDTVYENVDFFRNALPVLDRSLTADQSMRLRELIAPK